VNEEEDYRAMMVDELGVLAVREDVLAERMRFPEYAAVYTMYCNEGKWYHIVPEAVRLADGHACIPVCKCCRRHLKRKRVGPRVPPNSFAVPGNDTGLASRVKSLPQLSPLEEMVIALVRPFMVVWKLGTGRGHVSEGSQEALVGHAISFIQKAKYNKGGDGEFVTPAKSMRGLGRLVSVVFTGTPYQFQIHKNQMRQWKAFEINVERVMAWFQFLKVVNPLYKDVDLASWHEYFESGAVDSFVDDMLADAEAKDKNDAEAAAGVRASQDAAAQSDIAGVRAAADGEVGSLRVAGETEPIVHEVMVTSATTDLPPEEAPLEAVKSAILGPGPKRMEAEAVELTAADRPLNEYTDNPLLVMGSFQLKDSNVQCLNNTWL